MGESRGGEGSGHEVAATVILTAVIDSYHTEGREIRSLTLRREAETLWSLVVEVVGEPEPDEVMYFSSEEVASMAGTSPTRGSNGEREG